VFAKTIASFLLCVLVFPSAGSASESVAVSIEPDIVYGHKFGMALTMDCYRPAVATGAAVIFVNSGGFVSGKVQQYEIDENGVPSFVPPEELLLIEEGFHYPPLEQFSYVDLLEAGITVFDMRHGSSPKFTLEEMVGDILLGCRFVRENAATFAIDGDRLGLAGASAGGYLAAYAGLELGGEGGIRAMVTFYLAGYDFAADARDYPELIEGLPALQIPEAKLDELSLRHRIRPDAPPILILCGTEDFPFITAACQTLDGELRGLGAESKLVMYEGTGHEFRGEDGYDAEYGLAARKATAEWFAQRL
jgi:acetyl esterase/lipase